MDSRLLKAGAAAALGMTLLIPTFNAVNNSYVAVTEYPDWLPPPDQLPENLRPPEDFTPPDLPEDWQPPPDWKPPEGWEDWEPPADWAEKWGDRVPPAGACPPPVWRAIEDGANATFEMSGAGWEQEAAFTIPKYTLAIAVNHTVTDWTANRIRATVAAPGNAWQGENETNGARDPLTGQAGTTPETTYLQLFRADENGNAPAAEGTYSVSLWAEAPQGPLGSPLAPTPVEGQWSFTVDILVACGGAFG